MARPYTELPIGAIAPEGWVREQLVRMSQGMTGHLNEIYAKVCGPRNGWLGGDGDGWERGPYWLDGLVPLAYILGDEELKKKARPWIEWSLNNQAEDGYFGPVPFERRPKREPGIQKTPRRDWWPKMVMLKVLQQYYMATGDERVIELMKRYFRYQLKHLPDKPLEHWSFWGNRRGGDNMLVVYWLYNVTGEKFLLELAELLFEQTYPWTDHFLNRDTLSRHKTVHCVNLAQGIKQPIVYYQRHSREKYTEAVRKAFADISKFHGHPSGMYGADEQLHGMNPTQGSEFCSAVELMYSLENIIAITGDVGFADLLERVTFNALPAQAMDDFRGRQYYQQANQVMATAGHRNFYTDHEFDLVFGVTTGYPCCTTNMHQGWPKFVQNLWYATADDGLGAMVYGPCRVRAKVADGVEVRLREVTDYPFAEEIRFVFESGEAVEFALHLRIPAWCNAARIQINGKGWSSPKSGQVAIIHRRWATRDEVKLILPMELRTSRWYENSVAVERGPLVYALKIREEWKKVRDERFGDYYEVRPRDPWNYGLLAKSLQNMKEGFEVVHKRKAVKQPWNLENAPIEIETRGKRIEKWVLYDDMAGPLPCSPCRQAAGPEEEIKLVPYGCTTLRISEFPVIH